MSTIIVDKNTGHAEASVTIFSRGPQPPAAHSADEALSTIFVDRFVDTKRGIRGNPVSKPAEAQLLSF
ncbi:hypothetical protein MHZ93_07990 [Roseomonas sp. ACRSG]|nr:hypothetical protein [Roseomonas sp. ACRSG]